jgi:hypothetical protein
MAVPILSGAGLGLFQELLQETRPAEYRQLLDVFCSCMEDTQLFQKDDLRKYLMEEQCQTSYPSYFNLRSDMIGSGHDCLIVNFVRFNKLSMVDTDLFKFAYPVRMQCGYPWTCPGLYIDGGGCGGRAFYKLNTLIIQEYGHRFLCINCHSKYSHECGYVIVENQEREEAKNYSEDAVWMDKAIPEDFDASSGIPF